MPMGEARTRETRLWDGPSGRHAYEMAYERCTPIRDTVLPLSMLKLQFWCRIVDKRTT
jgi:hypothetical protein